MGCHALLSEDIMITNHRQTTQSSRQFYTRLRHLPEAPSPASEHCGVFAVPLDSSVHTNKAPSQTGETFDL